MADVLHRLQAALADRYTIERELGRGGMASVYLAEDRKHHRQVAIKVLRPELAAVLGPERFLREIEIAARLNHPHILPLFDSAEADGFLYYVMPCVEGESLRQRIGREKQLPIADALRITEHAAAALDYAHGHGVIHRDIKPENILLHSGEVLVADFGIALALREGGGERLTGTGFSLGTPEYMSPEQSRGEREIDARADVYALGCVLYEMLVGEPPYTGPTPEVVTAKRLADPVPAVRRFRDAVPRGVEQALMKALARVPADRFSSAGAFAEALAKPSAVRPSLRSIAVLPLLNLSADPENEYFADGVTEDIIAQLSRIGAFKVISRTSVMPFKKGQQSLKEIGAELGVGTLLEGSVRRAGNRVRIVVQLIDAETDEHLWAETYDRELTDVFAIQSDLAHRVAAALHAALTPAERERVNSQPTASMEAYSLYLLGRCHVNKRSPVGLRKAIECFEQAIVADPNYAAPYAGLADAYALLTTGTYGSPPSHAVMRAKGAAQQALELDDGLAEAHTSLAFVLFRCDWAWAEAERKFRRAIELNSNYAPAHHWYAMYLAAMGRHDEAEREIRRAQELDPLSLIISSAVGRIAHFAGRYEEAIKHYRETLQVDPNFIQAHFDLAMSYRATGRYAEAIREIEQAVNLGGPRTTLMAETAAVRALLGEESAARRILEELEKGVVGGSVSLPDIAVVYGVLGEKDRAVAALERAYEARSGTLVYLKVSGDYGSLRSEPRFQQLLRRMNFAP